MSYDVILVDVFNLYYRKQSKIVMKPFEQAAKYVKYVNSEIKANLREGGKLYLLYDPMPASDLGFSKKFTYASYRREIDSGYKATRRHSPDVQEVCRLIYNYYSYRGPGIINVWNNNYEADDYVEPLLEKCKGKKVALFTNDLDWAKYLNDDVVMINKSFMNPFTAAHFEEKYKYRPTPASVTVYKALFGDESDNVTGALKVKKIKFLAMEPTEEANATVQEIASSGIDIDTFVKRFKSYIHRDIILKDERTPEEELYIALNTAEASDSPLFVFLNNIRIIKSRCKDVDKCSTWQDIDDNMNNVIEVTLGLKKGSKKFCFGGVKIR